MPTDPIPAPDDYASADRFALANTALPAWIRRAEAERLAKEAAEASYQHYCADLAAAEGTIAELLAVVRMVKIRLHFPINRPGSWEREIAAIEAALAKAVNP